MKYPLYLLLALLFLAACGPEPLRSSDDLDIGEPFLSLSFDSPSDFETGDYPEAGAALSLEDGRYLIRQGGERTAYIWGQGGEPIQDVVVEALAMPQTNYPHDLYGLMCRLDANGAGYLFLLSSDGFGAIARTDGRSLAFLLPWRQSGAINTGPAENTIRGVCVGDYLALYVNGEWLGDVRDSTYSQAGQVGLAAGLFIEGAGESAEVVVAFDDLRLSPVSLQE
jgi:hypothetical protein